MMCVCALEGQRIAERRLQTDEVKLIQCCSQLHNVLLGGTGFARSRWGQEG